MSRPRSTAAVEPDAAPAPRALPARTSPAPELSAIARIPACPPCWWDVRAAARARIVVRLRAKLLQGPAHDPEDELAHRRLREEVTRDLRGRSPRERRVSYDRAREVIAVVRATVMDVAARIAIEDLQVYMRAFAAIYPSAPAADRAAARRIASSTYQPGPADGCVLAAVADEIVPRVSSPQKITTPKQFEVDTTLRQPRRRCAPTTPRTSDAIAFLLARRSTIEEHACAIATGRWGYSPGEVCAALGISVDAIKARRSRSRRVNRHQRATTGR